MLRRASQYLDLSQRQLFANGIFLSKASYVCSLISGQSRHFFSNLQSKLNQTLRCIRGVLKKRGELLYKFSESIGWLPYRKLCIYHSLVLFKKSLNDHMNKIFHRNLKQSTREGRIHFKDRPRLQTVRREWRHFSGEIFNCLPADIKNTTKLGLFKAKVKSWLFSSDEKLFDRFLA